MFWISTISVIVLLISFNALYVAAEFSAVSSKKARLAKQFAEGNSIAGSILQIVKNPAGIDNYVATCQVGITLSSLILGYYGQAKLSDYISPGLSRIGFLSPATIESVSAAVILIFLSILQILMGELVPKNVGLQIPERLATHPIIYIPMQWSKVIFRPLIWLFNGSGVLLMRLLKLEPGEEHTHIHSPEEIVLLIDESSEEGQIDEEEHLMLRNTLRMRDEMVRKVMIPRARMLSAPSALPHQTLLSLVADSPYSRIPVFQDTIDNIIGVVHLRDLLCSVYNPQKNSEAQISIIRPIPFVPETMLVKDVFSLLQNRQFQVAIVLDEFGGTAGMVTLEDMVEEIFGDLQDEFDASNPYYQIRPNNEILIRGDMLLEDINELFEWKLIKEGVDTIGGYIQSLLGHIPQINEEIIINEQSLKIEKMRGKGIAFISMKTSREMIDKLGAQE